jgi:hypothetical protein
MYYLQIRGQTKWQNPQRTSFVSKSHSIFERPEPPEPSGGLAPVGSAIHVAAAGAPGALAAHGVPGAASAATSGPRSKRQGAQYTGKPCLGVDFVGTFRLFMTFLYFIFLSFVLICLPAVFFYFLFHMGFYFLV